jgi:NAD(P)H-dependent FMN reductase
LSAPTILVLSGSTRSGSLNARLAALAATRLTAAGAKATLISLADFPLPFVDADGFGNAPAEATQLRETIDAHKGMFIACPEYNAGYPALLKNALDWATVAKPGAPASGLAGKVVGLGGASPGAMGAYRALTQFRTMLELGMGALVLPETVAVGGADKAFTEDGGLTDARTSGFLDALVSRLVRECSVR